MYKTQNMNKFIVTGVIFVSPETIWFISLKNVDTFATLLDCSQAGEILNTPKTIPSQLKALCQLKVLYRLLRY
jgi:hypothetical protein